MSMKPPSESTPYDSILKQLAGNVLPTGQKNFGLDPKVFNELIEGHGIRMVHAKPVPCPFRLTINGDDHDPSCESCHNGFMYYGQREFIGVFMGNSSERRHLMQGSYDFDQAMVLIPSKDANGEELDIQFFDQISIPDFTVRYYQLVEYSQTGVDRLHFPATNVDFLVDAQGKQYTQGKDFTLDERGYIKWLTQNRPGYGMGVSNKGTIYAVNYYTKPVFTIVNLPHQIRATQMVNKDGQTVQERFPQLAVVRKDFIPHDPNDKVGKSDAPSPDDGGFNRP